MSQDLSLEAIAYHCVKGRAETTTQAGHKPRKGHKPYEKHVRGRDARGNRIKDEETRNGLKKNEFKNLGIKTKQQYHKHIVDTLNDPKTQAFRSTDGRNLYYNRKTNTYIVQNNRDPTGCTCFRHRNKDKSLSKSKYFERRVKEACQERGISYEKGKQEIKEGGYNALYQKRELKTEKKPETDKERRAKEVAEHMKRQEMQRQKGRER